MDRFQDGNARLTKVGRALARYLLRNIIIKRTRSQNRM
jgi:hypothetical protein